MTTDLRSKPILCQDLVREFILSTIVGDHSKNPYTTLDKWNDGGDIVYAPTTPSSTFPPFIVQVRDTVDSASIRELIMHCVDTATPPIALTFCLKNASSQVTLENSEKEPFLKKIACSFWAEQYFVITPTTIDDHLSNEPFHPLVALEYVLVHHQCSLSELEYNNHPTVKLIHSIVKRAIGERQVPEVTEDVVVDVCTEVRNRFKRVLEAADGSGYDRVRQYANEGIAYAETCVQKYKRQRSSSDS